MVSPKNKIVFIELDGASWNVINPLLKQGELPHIEKLMRNGVSGDLLSDPPLISPRLWVSIFTGKHSRKHGVEFFGNSSSMVRCKRVWDILQDYGETVGVFGSFATWPPYPVQGFMIPSIFALGSETYPEEYRFFQELLLHERKKGKQLGSRDGREEKSPSLFYYARQLRAHGVQLRVLGEAALDFMMDRIKRSPGDERYWKRAIAHLKISTDLFLHLYRQYNPMFATFHIHVCDALCHRYWKYYEPDKFHDVDSSQIEKYGDVIPNAYRVADQMIGKIIKEVGNAVVIVMSDHGSTAMESTKVAYRLHVENFLNRFRLSRTVIPAHVGLMTFCYFQEKEQMEQVATLLEKVVFEDTGECVFDICREESLFGLRLSRQFWGKTIEESRKIVMGEFGCCSFSDLFLPQKMEVSGTHQKEGILIMSGPGVRRGFSLSGATIFDITPTALAMAGYPTGEDMDGRVLTHALEKDFLKNHPVRFIKSYEGSAEGEERKIEEVSYTQIKGRLESLGYL